MQSDRARLFSRLEELGIATTTVEHEPVFAVAQSQELRGTLERSAVDPIQRV